MRISNEVAMAIFSVPLLITIVMTVMYHVGFIENPFLCLVPMAIGYIPMCMIFLDRSQ